MSVASASELSEFRRRLREWLAAHTPPPGAAASKAEHVQRAKQFQAELHDAGFAGLTWPKPYGGQGLGHVHQLAFEDEARRFDLPTRPLLVGLGMCGPTLLDLGTEAQKKRLVRPLLRGDEVWCQLFSEPGAGSDIASLQTRAVRDDDGWLLTGQKVWTTGADVADFGAVVARTDPDVPKHQGLTMFVLDMRSPGITVRPLRDMSGRALFNEVFLDDVRVPTDAVLGEVNRGWAATVTMLGHERVSVGADVSPRSNPLTFSSLVETFRRRCPGADTVARDALTDLYVRERAVQLLNARLRQESQAGLDIGARGSVAKLAAALLERRSVDVAGLVSGSLLPAWDASDTHAADLVTAVLAAPGSGIAGGTNEIQHNILGERVLGLPKEPQLDQDIPFRELTRDAARATSSTRRALPELA